MGFSDLIKNFFTHKDFLPKASEIPGTLFTPLHIAFSLFCIAIIALICVALKNKSEKTLRMFFAVLWAFLVVAEVSKILWETYTGKSVDFEWRGILPLYPCSIFLYAMPFAVWGKGRVRYAACGYVCTLGFVGGAVNFVYPANILGNYSCISFAGFHTFIYHGAIVTCMLLMLLSGYHSYTRARHFSDLLLPSVPFLVMSVAANIVNFSKIDADYMFFKLESFIFAPVGAATPDLVSVILVYAVYILIHAAPYLPFYVKNRKSARLAEA